MELTERIMVVDDEKTIRAVIVEALEGRGFQVKDAEGPSEALRHMEGMEFDLALVDLKMPGPMDGIGLLEEIHRRSPQTVVIVMSGYATLDSAIAALRRGAFDYITKPASMAQIVESVERGLEKRHDGIRHQQLITHLEETLDELKRQGKQEETSSPEDGARFVQTPTLTIDRKKRLVVRGTEPVELTATEFDLLDFLARNSDRVVTASELVQAVQGYGLAEADARPIVRVHIQRLRQKLEDDPESPIYIQNVRGRGYRFTG